MVLAIGRSGYPQARVMAWSHKCALVLRRQEALVSDFELVDEEPEVELLEADRESVR